VYNCMCVLCVYNSVWMSKTQFWSQSMLSLVGLIPGGWWKDSGSNYKF
jgi:hypothetical protein